MQLLIRPVLDPSIEIDVTRPLIAAIAHEIWTRCGGSPQINWLEAELHLSRFFRRETDHSAVPALVLRSRATDAILEERLRQLAHAVPGRRTRTRVRPHARRRRPTPQRRTT